MFRSKRIISLLLMMVLVLPILAACGGGDATTVAPTATTDNTGQVEPTAATEATEEVMATDMPEATEEVMATDEPMASNGTDMEKTIIIGMGQAPDTLFGIESTSSATTQVLAAVQPACITTLSYEYQPVCFEKVPSLEDGDALTVTVTVDNTYEGNFVVNDEVMTDTSVLTEAMELDQFQVTWKIIPGLMWEDGEPVTADDFVFAFNLYQDDGIQMSSRYVIERTEKFEVVDESTFTWYGAPGYSDATYFANYFGPEPEHVLGEMTPGDIGGSDYASQPLSYGPYTIVEHIPDQSTTLVANENYWKAGEGLPKVGNLVYKYLTSQDQIIQQLEGAEIDVVGSIGLTLAQAPLLDELEAEGLVTAQYVPATVWEHFDFGIERNDGVPSLVDDVMVRQAIAYGTDRQQIIDEVLFGKTVVMNSFLPEDHWAYPPNGEGLEPYEYDTEKAMALLEEAGWVDSDGDGVRENGDRTLTLQFYTTEQNETRQSVAQIFQENMREIGVEVELNFVPGPASLFKNGEDGILTGRRFDVAMYAWVSGSEPSTALYLCDQIPTADNAFSGQNNPGYCSEEYDAPALASQSETDRAKRIPFAIEAQQIFNRDLPTFPLYQRVNVGAYRTGVTGLDLNPTSQVDFWNLEEWDIEN